MTVKPIRLQLSRRKGFDLQAASRAANELEAVNVARPSKWGNPFSVHPHHAPGRPWNGVAGGTYSMPTAADAVAAFRDMFDVTDAGPDSLIYMLRQHIHELRGKNLACWCKPGEPCHADVLLELANRPTCEAV